jgi:dihydropyrimidinase
MADFDLVIVNGVVVTAEEVGEFDVGIKAGKIVKVVPKGGLLDVSSTKTIDAKGGYVMVFYYSIPKRPSANQVQPGGIDAHVHLQEPPLFGKGSTADNYETGIVDISFALVQD